MRASLPIPGPLGLGELLDRAFRLYRGRAGTLLLTAALFLVPLGLVTGLISGRVTTDMLSAMTELGAATPSAATESAQVLGALGGSMFGAFFVIVLTALVNGVATLVLTRQVIDLLHGHELPLARSIRAGLAQLVPFFVMRLTQGCLTGVLMGLAAIPAFFLLFALGLGLGVSGLFVDNAPIAATVVSVMVFLAGLLAMLAVFLLPILYVSGRWIVALPGLVDRSWGGIGALQNSWQLTRGQIWRAIGFTVLLGALSQILSLVLVAPIFLPLGIFVRDPGLQQAIAGSLSALVLVLWQPFYAVATVLFYHDLLVRQEGYDLALRIEQLEAEARSMPDLQTTTPHQESLTPSTTDEDAGIGP